MYYSNSVTPGLRHAGKPARSGIFHEGGGRTLLRASKIRGYWVLPHFSRVYAVTQKRHLLSKKSMFQQQMTFLIHLHGKWCFCLTWVSFPSLLCHTFCLVISILPNMQLHMWQNFQPIPISPITDIHVPYI